MDGLVLRRAERADLETLGQLAAALVRLHHRLDPARFFVVEPVETGYRWWLEKQLDVEDVVLIVAERAGSIVGYGYAALEERDWMALRDACGMIHDVFVVETERRSGVARAIVDRLTRELAALGAPLVVLSTAAKNEGAQRFFAALGFRPTMIEMALSTGLSKDESTK